MLFSTAKDPKAFLKGKIIQLVDRAIMLDKQAVFSVVPQIGTVSERASVKVNSLKLSDGNVSVDIDISSSLIGETKNYKVEQQTVSSLERGRDIVYTFFSKINGRDVAFEVAVSPASNKLISRSKKMDIKDLEVVSMKYFYAQGDYGKPELGRLFDGTEYLKTTIFVNGSITLKKNFSKSGDDRSTTTEFLYRPAEVRKYGTSKKIRLGTTHVFMFPKIDYRLDYADDQFSQNIRVTPTGVGEPLIKLGEMQGSQPNIGQFFTGAQISELSVCLVSHKVEFANGKVYLPDEDYYIMDLIGTPHPGIVYPAKIDMDVDLADMYRSEGIAQKKIVVNGTAVFQKYIEYIKVQENGILHLRKARLEIKYETQRKATVNIIHSIDNEEYCGFIKIKVDIASYSKDIRFEDLLDFFDYRKFTHGVIDLEVFVSGSIYKKVCGYVFDGVVDGINQKIEFTQLKSRIFAGDKTPIEFYPTTVSARVITADGQETGTVGELFEIDSKAGLGVATFCYTDDSGAQKSADIKITTINYPSSIDSPLHSFGSKRGDSTRLKMVGGKWIAENFMLDVDRFGHTKLLPVACFELGALRGFVRPKFDTSRFDKITAYIDDNLVNGTLILPSEYAGLKDVHVFTGNAYLGKFDTARLQAHVISSPKVMLEEVSGGLNYMEISNAGVHPMLLGGDTCQLYAASDPSVTVMSTIFGIKKRGFSGHSKIVEVQAYSVTEALEVKITNGATLFPDGDYVAWIEGIERQIKIANGSFVAVDQYGDQSDPCYVLLSKYIEEQANAGTLSDEAVLAGKLLPSLSISTRRDYDIFRDAFDCVDFSLNAYSWCFLGKLPVSSVDQILMAPLLRNTTIPDNEIVVGIRLGDIRDKLASSSGEQDFWITTSLQVESLASLASLALPDSFSHAEVSTDITDELILEAYKLHGAGLLGANGFFGSAEALEGFNTMHLIDLQDLPGLDKSKPITFGQRFTSKLKLHSADVTDTTYSSLGKKGYVTEAIVRTRQNVEIDCGLSDNKSNAESFAKPTKTKKVEGESQTFKFYGGYDKTRQLEITTKSTQDLLISSVNLDVLFNE